MLPAVRLSAAIRSFGRGGHSATVLRRASSLARAPQPILGGPLLSRPRYEAAALFSTVPPPNPPATSGGPTKPKDSKSVKPSAETSQQKQGVEKDKATTESDKNKSTTEHAYSKSKSNDSPTKKENEFGASSRFRQTVPPYDIGSIISGPGDNGNPVVPFLAAAAVVAAGFYGYNKYTNRDSKYKVVDKSILGKPPSESVKPSGPEGVEPVRIKERALPTDKTDAKPKSDDHDKVSAGAESRTEPHVPKDMKDFVEDQVVDRQTGTPKAEQVPQTTLQREEHGDTVARKEVPAPRFTTMGGTPNRGPDEEDKLEAEKGEPALTDGASEPKSIAALQHEEEEGTLEGKAPLQGEERLEGDADGTIESAMLEETLKEKASKQAEKEVDEDSVSLEELNKIYADGDYSDSFRNALKEIVEALGTGKIDPDIVTRQERAKDDWSYHTGKVPLLIVYPESTEDVSSLLRICNKHVVPVLPVGCRTSLEGHTIDVRGSIVCDMTRMNQVVELHKEDADVVVQAGIQWMELNETLQQSGFFFPMDPGPGAAIGGMMGTCCSGTNAVKYGVMKDWVLSATVVLANGDIVKLGTRARKDVAGYDLTRLFVGSEGTLGIITEATLKLAPRPPHEVVAVCNFPSTHEACAAVAEIIRRGIPVSGAEYLDPLAMRIVNEEGRYGFTEKPTIMFRFSGTPAQLEDAEKNARDVSETFGGEDFQYRSSVEDPAEVDRLWSARKNLLFHAIAWSQGRESWITDVCVPIGRLPDILQETMDDLDKSKLDAPVFGHVGDGNFHTAILFHPENAEEAAEAELLNERMIMRAIKADGTCTGEHGVGMGKMKYLAEQSSPEALKLMKLIKQTLDPNLILNPEKIISFSDMPFSH